MQVLSRFSLVRLCATLETGAYQAPPSLRFSRQEHWSGLPFPSPMHESQKWKWSRSVMSDSSRPHGLQPTRLLCPWDFPGKSTGVGCHHLLHRFSATPLKLPMPFVIEIEQKYYKFVWKHKRPQIAKQSLNRKTEPGESGFLISDYTTESCVLS